LGAGFEPWQDFGVLLPTAGQFLYRGLAHAGVFIQWAQALRMGKVSGSSFQPRAQFLYRGLAHARVFIGLGVGFEPWQGFGVLFPAAGQFLHCGLAQVAVFIGLGVGFEPWPPPVESRCCLLLPELANASLDFKDKRNLLLPVARAMQTSERGLAGNLIDERSLEDHAGELG
jgi:hypothetical protein